MKKIEKTLVVGAGSVGLMVASQIYQAGPQMVSILAGGERLVRYRKESLRVNGQVIPFNLIDVQDKSSPDLIIIACKFHHLEQVIADIKNHVGPETLILSLLNGITSEEIIGKAYGMERIPLSMILSTDAQHQGTETIFTKKGTIFFGDAQNTAGAYSPRVERIKEFFERCSIAYQIPENMINRLWFKFMMNVGINQCTAVTQTPYQPFQNNGRAENLPFARALLESAMAEVVRLSEVMGTGLTTSDFADVYKAINPLDPLSRTSMSQDVQAKRKTEVEMFAPVVSALGNKHNIPTPVNDLLYRAIRVMEEGYLR